MTGVDERIILGIDIGTGSARAGLFDAAGRMIGSAKADLSIWRGPGPMVEQSSAQIWDAVCRAVRGAVDEARVEPARIVGIGFDATCSLVVLGAGGVSLPVGPSEDPARDVIVWMDHRAVGQAERINALRHDVLKYVGGTISPEMETPKLLWLKENRSEIYAQAWAFFDLADFLTWKATGDLARSSCTVTCKWTYLAHERRWDPSYLEGIGLGDLAQADFVRIGTHIVDPGTALGSGLTEQAARDLGLAPGTAVAAGMIDAFAGGLGTVGIEGTPSTHMAYVFGTSSCTITSTDEPLFMPGVWGPYYSAMIPGLWLNEGGQSAAGAAIDRLIEGHPAWSEARELARSRGIPVSELLTQMLVAKAPSLSEIARVADGIHVVPEFLGNRAPFADPHARAVIAGLGMERDLESLAALYLAGICGVGYGLRQIIEAQAKAGAKAEKIVICGGAGQSRLIRQLLADAIGKPVMASRSAEPVLLGSATLGAVAGGLFPDILTAIGALSHPGETCLPAGGEIAGLHDRRFDAFCRLQTVAREIR